jgi:cob(I)alamin adenosyltransferase
MIYLNRLSSLLFMTALVSNRRLGIEERIWDIRRES